MTTLYMGYVVFWIRYDLWVAGTVCVYSRVDIDTIYSIICFLITLWKSDDRH